MLIRMAMQFDGIAEQCAAMSKDPSTRVGAVVADGKELVSMGYNGFPPGIADDDRLKVRESKYRLTIHAEMNAILRAGGRAAGCTLYTWPLLPCSECAKHVVAAGIRRVVAVQPYSDGHRWEASISLAMDIFKEAGVEVCTHVSW
jgi:dCMP deaminase